MNEIAIITIPQERALEVFTTEKGLDPYIDQVKAQVEGFVPDVTTKKGRDEIASLAHRVARSKTAMDSIGKDVVAELKKQPQLVDAERKRMRDQMDDLKAEIRKPLTEWEAAEEKRKAAHESAIANIALLMQDYHELDSAEISGRLAKVGEFVVDESLEEYQEKAAITKDQATEVLKAALAKQLAREQEQEELNRLRQQEQERREEEARQRQQQQEAATDEPAKASTAPASEPTQEVVPPQANQQPAKRDPVNDHRILINQEAAQSLIDNGIDALDAHTIVRLVADGEVRHIKIHY